MKKNATFAETKHLIKMKKLFGISAFMAFAALSFTSCQPKITGTWMDGLSNESMEESGFTLLEDGTALPINMGYREYYAWEKKGDNLILKLLYTGTNPHEDADTLKIIKVTKEELFLEDGGGNPITYKRKVAEPVSSVPKSVDEENAEK